MIEEILDKIQKVWYDKTMSRYQRNRILLIKEQIQKQDVNYCEYCGRAPLQKYNDGKRNFLTIDHIIPKHLGGTDDLHNLTIACLDCNRRKGSKLYDEEIQEGN